MKIIAAIVAAALTLYAGLGVTVRPVKAAQTWKVVVGGGVKDARIVSNTFAPRTLEIAVGDTVTFEFTQPWAFHTISFLSGEKAPDLIKPEGKKMYLNPQVFFPAGDKTYDGTGYRNSGAPPEAENLSSKFSYSLTFTKAGTYNYQCLLHGPASTGTIVVKDKVDGTPDAAAAKARAEFDAVLKAGEAAYAKWNPHRSGNKVHVTLTGDTKAGWTNLRFTREPLTVKRGTTVTWAVRDPFEIHTVTFTSGAKAPEFVVVEPQKGGPPKLLMNPKAAAPTPNKTYDGKGYVNSGLLFPPGAPGNPPSEYSLTFPKAGRYEYICVIHAAWGMKGTVVVQ
jgi:plastocyanin